MANMLKPMFVALPLPKGIGADELLRGYLFALEGENLTTLRSVIVRLCKGTWYENVVFCPHPPELANMVRAEQRRIEAENRTRLSPPAPVSKPFKDVRITQRERAKELESKGYWLCATDVSHEKFASMARNRKLPVGSLHLWAIDEVWAPKAATQAAQANERDVA